MRYSIVLLLPTTLAFNLLSLPESANTDLPKSPEGTPENPACIQAYNATIDCDPAIITNSFGDESKTPSEEQLNSICTSTCLDSLRAWVRGGPGCEGETYLNYFGLQSEGFLDGENKTSIDDVYQYYITAAYHSKCLKDLSTDKYCLLSDVANGFTQPAILNTSNPDTLCKENTCGTQAAYLFDPVKTIYKYDPSVADNGREGGDLPMVSLSEACPDIDTSKYPTREAAVSGGSGGNKDGAQNKDNKPNSAASNRFSAGLLMGVVGVVGYLAL